MIELKTSFKFFYTTEYFINSSNVCLCDDCHSKKMWGPFRDIKISAEIEAHAVHVFDSSGFASKFACILGLLGHMSLLLAGICPCYLFHACAHLCQIRVDKKSSYV